MPAQYAKPALTFEEQLQQLARRGLAIGSREDALGTLSRVSYYRLSAYWYPFKRADDSFEPGATFEPHNAMGGPKDWQRLALWS